MSVALKEIATKTTDDQLNIIDNTSERKRIIQKGVKKYHQYLDAITNHYLATIHVEDILQRRYGKEANIIHINGIFPQETFSHPKPGNSPLYVAGYSVFHSYMAPEGYPQPAPEGLFVGFAGEVTLDPRTQAEYAIPKTFGVTSHRNIVDHPYAWNARLAGKTHFPTPMGAQNLNLLPEFYPAMRGLYGLEELQSYLLEDSVITDAKAIIERGIEKDIRIQNFYGRKRHYSSLHL